MGGAGVAELLLELLDASLLADELLVVVGLLLEEALDRLGRNGEGAWRGHVGWLWLWLWLVPLFGARYETLCWERGQVKTLLHVIQCLGVMRLLCRWVLEDSLTGARTRFLVGLCLSGCMMHRVVTAVTRFGGPTKLGPPALRPQQKEATIGCAEKGRYRNNLKIRIEELFLNCINKVVAHVISHVPSMITLSKDFPTHES